MGTSTYGSGMCWQQRFPGYLTGSVQFGSRICVSTASTPISGLWYTENIKLFQLLGTICKMLPVHKMPMKIKKTMAFQTGDIRDLLTRTGDPQLDGGSSGLMPDSRLENARNARLLLDRRPCSTYWLLVGRSRGTMSKMSSHTIGNRHLWLFGPGKKMKGSRPPTDSPGEMLLRADAAHIFGSCLKGWRKGLPQLSQAVPFGVI